MFSLIAQRAAMPAPQAAVKTVVEAAEPITDFATAFGTPQMRLIAIFLVIDIILGIAAAIASKKFNFNQLATFMATGVLPYLFGFAVVELVAQEFTLYGQMAITVIFVTIVLNLLGSIISNLASLGVNMPSILKKTT